jgi:hypothetical protein
VRYQSFKERDNEIKALIQTLHHTNSTNIATSQTQKTPPKGEYSHNVQVQSKTMSTPASLLKAGV